MSIYTVFINIVKPVKKLIFNAFSDFYFHSKLSHAHYRVVFIPRT